MYKVLNPFPNIKFTHNLQFMCPQLLKALIKLNNSKVMNNEFTMSLTSNFGSTAEKVGITTTVKQQMDNIEITIDHFKKCIDTQRKQQNQLDTQLQNLQKSTDANLKNMLNQVALRSKQLIESFNLESLKQSKEIEYLELQKKIIEDEHQKLNELSHSLSQRVAETEQSVGV